MERVKVATQLERDLLVQTRALAESEGRLLQSLFEEALKDLLKKYKVGHPRQEVIDAYLESLPEYAPLYERLAR